MNVIKMIKQLFSLIFFILVVNNLNAQTPTPIIVNGPVGQAIPNPEKMVCNDAGTSTQTLFPTAQSNDVLYLCLGDSMAITHMDGDLSGDPDILSDPGYSYVFYDCPPTIIGDTWSMVLTDPCLFTDPDPDPATDPDPTPGSSQLWSVQSGVDINGNATFFNNGQIQTIFGMGDPIQIWFAPITLDDFNAFGPDTTLTGIIGPCVNVNTTDAFSIVYLNEIVVSNINTNYGGNGCSGSFDIAGGFPEYDNSNFFGSDVTITNVDDPTIIGDITSGSPASGGTFVFSVPQPGTYEIVVDDDKSCSVAFEVEMFSCIPVTVVAPEVVGTPGEVFCADFTTQDFVNVASIQFSLEWDNTILSYQSFNEGELTLLNGLSINTLPNGDPNPTGLGISWFDFTLVSPLTLNNDDVLFQICFEVIGDIGDNTSILFQGPVSPEVFDGDGEQIGFNGIEGQFTAVGVDLLVLLVQDSVSCGGSTDGTVNLTAAGGIAPYIVDWQMIPAGVVQGPQIINTEGGSTDIVGLSAGLYSITTTDSENPANTSIDTIEVLEPPSLGVNIMFDQPLCNGDSNGSVNAVVFVGGVTIPLPDPDYSFSWNSGMYATSTVTNIPSGVYDVVVTHIPTGCTAVASTTMSQPAPIVPNIMTVDESCAGGGGDGSATASPSGGIINIGSDYQYSWEVDLTETGNMLSNLSAGGPWSLTVTDDNACEVVGMYSINSPAPPVIVSFDSISITCANESDGALTVHAFPGNAAIDSYTWDSNVPQSDSTIIDLSPGWHYVTVTAQDGCTAIDSAFLFAPSPMVLDSIVQTPPTCPGDNNGTISVFVSGGTDSYLYDWGNLTSLFNLRPGLTCDSTYAVTVTDDNMNNCDTIVLSIYLDCPPEIGVQFDNLQDVTCNNGVPCDGQATAIAFGGTAGTGNYNFTWLNSGEVSSGGTMSTATALCQGLNFIEINDGACSIDTFLTIGAPAALSINTDQTFGTPTTCFGTSDGTATVEATGGTPGYTYLWNDGTVGQTITDVPAGPQTLIITDANDCTFAFTIEIDEPDTLIAAIDFANTIPVSCNGENDGQIAVMWTGGNLGGNTSFDWNPLVSNSSVATDLSVGPYAITITDQNGCSDSISFNLPEPPPIIADIPLPMEPQCFGYQTFLSVDTAFGGNGPLYSFSVNGGLQQQIGATVPILAGQQIVRVFDGIGCSFVDTVVVNQPPQLVPLFNPPVVEIELGDSLELDPNFGPLIYAIDSIGWSPTSTLNCNGTEPLCENPIVTPLTSTTYTITVVDENGCIGIGEILVEVDKNRNIFIPNAFSPNYDGMNDDFKVYGGAGVERVNFFRVFDRWGELLYEANNFVPDALSNEGWDGTFNGKDMHMGVYVYLIEVVFVDNTVLLYRGDVTLTK